MSSTNGALTFTSFCSSGFNISSLSGYMGTDLFKTQTHFLCPKLSLHSHVSQIPEYKF